MAPSIDGRGGWDTTRGYSRRWKGAMVSGARMAGTNVKVPRNGTFHRWKVADGARRVCIVTDGERAWGQVGMAIGRVERGYMVRISIPTR
jgi:hypothetical protein